MATLCLFDEQATSKKCARKMRRTRQVYQRQQPQSMSYCFTVKPTRIDGEKLGARSQERSPHRPMGRHAPEPSRSVENGILSKEWERSGHKGCIGPKILHQNIDQRDAAATEAGG